jgi:hypothetical protein
LVEKLVTKRANWVIDEKMRLGVDDDIVEASIEFLDNGNFAVESILRNGHIRRIVSKNKELSHEILNQLNRRMFC